MYKSLPVSRETTSRSSMTSKKKLDAEDVQRIITQIKISERKSMPKIERFPSDLAMKSIEHVFLQSPQEKSDPLTVKWN